MEFAADFHIHSKYSRATSQDLDIENLTLWAKKKGIGLLGTGDFTHPLWLKELKIKLEPTDKGLFVHKGMHFILTVEVSNIYSKNGKTYRNHTVILAPSFKTVDRIIAALSKLGMNLNSDGRPILGMDIKDTCKLILDINPSCFIIPAHIWTPWFSVFGSKSGFDKFEDCFEEVSEKITCVETGLSSDPAMNWRLSALDRFTLVSNSDAHSLAKIGRECNIFDCDLTYVNIIDTLRTKDKKRFLYTVEFFPEEGKYHFDGHSACKISFSPEESKKHGDRCPECGKPLVLGVMHRVDELADRPVGYKPKDPISYKSCIPLNEIIADVKGVGAASKVVLKEYNAIISYFGNEREILTNVPEETLRKSISPDVAEAIIKVREGSVHIVPGFDGEYGKIKIFKEREKSSQEAQELTLF